MVECKLLSFATFRLPLFTCCLSHYKTSSPILSVVELLAITTKYCYFVGSHLPYGIFFGHLGPTSHVNTSNVSVGSSL